MSTSWYPRLSFTAQGPIGGGSQMSVTFRKPDGSVWLTQLLETPEIGGDDTRQIDMPTDSVKDERHAILATGLFSFSIDLKNALTGKSATLYEGPFKVGKFHFGSTEPKFKDNFEYYVDHDWNLPIGYLYFDDKIDEEAPRLRLVMWFRGEVSQEKLAGYVFYRDQEICSTKVADQGSSGESAVVATPGLLPETRWVRWRFDFNAVPQTHKMTSANRYPAHFHFLDKHPGEYVVKVLRDGKLARAAKFTVGPDGKVVENGLAAKNRLGTPWMLLPVQVEPGQDGKASLAGYKTDAFYGNPLVDFP